MPSLKQLGHVARFELREALGSRLVVVLLLLYGGGALLASGLFLQLLHAAEEAAREMLAVQMGTDPASLPANLVREQAMPWLVQLVDDPPTRERLLRMDALSIFFGFVTLESVALLVLMTATRSITQDLTSGAVRFVLVRVGRLTWTLGKILGQALLLGLGLVLAATVTGLTGLWIDGTFEPARGLWLASTALCSWFFGLAYLGIFSGVSMIARTPVRARAGALLVWLGLSIGHALAGAEWLQLRFPPVSLALWIFPSHYQPWLWSGSPWRLAAAAGSLLLLGGLGFALGHRVFESRDA